MRFIANYFRQVFCKHSFIIEERVCQTDERTGIKVSLFCNKCGYNRKFWKYL